MLVPQNLSVRITARSSSIESPVSLIFAISALFFAKREFFGTEFGSDGEFVPDPGSPGVFVAGITGFVVNPRSVAF